MLKGLGLFKQHGSGGHGDQFKAQLKEGVDAVTR